jgi:hypothetical protein
MHTNILKVSTILDVPPPTFAGDPVQKLSTAPKFSGHRLQIEMKGPNFRPLSIMDTPGLYHCKKLSSTFGSQLIFSAHSDPENMELAAEIQSLVERLIKEKQTIIMRVFPLHEN